LTKTNKTLLMAGFFNGTHVNGGYFWEIKHDPEFEGYKPLTVEQFAEARMEEFYNALRALVVPEEMISHRIRVVSWRPGGITPASCADKAPSRTLQSLWRRSVNLVVKSSAPNAIVHSGKRGSLKRFLL
jgi:hypothetical protein